MLHCRDHNAAVIDDHQFCLGCCSLSSSTTSTTPFLILSAVAASATAPPGSRSVAAVLAAQSRPSRSSFSSSPPADGATCTAPPLFHFACIHSVAAALVCLYTHCGGRIQPARPQCGYVSWWRTSIKRSNTSKSIGTALLNPLRFVLVETLFWRENAGK